MTDIDITAATGDGSTTIAWLQAETGRINAANGWREDGVTPVERLALITCEVSEAIEEVRDGHCVDEAYYNGTKPERVPVELADVVIRCFVVYDEDDGSYVAC